MPTVIARFLNAAGSPAPGPVVFRPLIAPAVVGAVFQQGAPVAVPLDAQGGLAVALHPGAYLVDDGLDRPFPVTLPAPGGDVPGDATYNLADLVQGGAALAQPVNPVSPSFRFRDGALLLRSYTDRQFYTLGLNAGLAAVVATIPAGVGWPGARVAPVPGTSAGCLQLVDPVGGWHTVWLVGPPGAPALAVGPADTSTAQALRLGPDVLQLPNVASGGFHALFVVGGQAGRTLAFGPNEA
jgi:hypothetical protein